MLSNYHADPVSVDQGGTIMRAVCRGKHYLLLACSLSTLLGVCGAVQAGGNGEIVLTRIVQPHPVGNPPMHPDPDPNTVNANPSPQVMGATHELTDGDFAGVSTGTSIRHTLLPNGSSLPGLNTSNGLPGMTNGHGGGSGGTLSNTIGNSIEQGMRPLSALSQGK